jgi:hypothetical protein
LLGVLVSSFWSLLHTDLLVHSVMTCNATKIDGDQIYLIIVDYIDLYISFPKKRLAFFFQ